MTGHIGERRNRDVAVVTRDFRLYHKLVPYFEEQGIKVLVLAPADAVPASVRVLVGGPQGDARSLPLMDDMEALLLAVCYRLDDRDHPLGYRRLVVGIDPGKRIGLAVLGDGRPIMVGIERSPESAAGRIARWVQALPAQAVSVHVGRGAPSVGRPLVHHIGQALPHARILRVPEDDTTPFAHVTGSRHTDAAIHIALRQPRSLP